MNPLKVGDICVGFNFISDVEYNGMECTLVAQFTGTAYHPKTNVHFDIVNGWEVIWENGTKHMTPQSHLKRRDDPTTSHVVEIYQNLIDRIKQPVEV